MAASMIHSHVVMTCIISASFALSANRTFTIDYKNDTFVKDGQPFRYISGSIHYQRVPHQYWEDRLRKMYAAGLNAIQTYVPWNLHEPFPGLYNFTGQHDLVHFLKLAHSLGLLVILRPGPYICAEWEFGGFPAWLMKEEGIKLRTNDPKYLKPVDRWLTVLYAQIWQLLYINGGPIIMVQIENEYGSYPACDYNYMRFLRQKAIDSLHPDVLLFSTDGDGEGYLKCGTLQDVYTTVDFGITDNPAKSFAVQRMWQPRGPYVNSEFYVGWLDHWGQNHSQIDKDKFAFSLDLMLLYGASVNIYMFEGGTNFGYMNGANDPSYQPVPTSYDYDAPLSEAGDVTDKYYTIRQIISKHSLLPEMKIPPSVPKSDYGTLKMVFISTVQDMLDKLCPSGPVYSKFPLSFEDLDHYYGFVLYRTKLKRNIVNETLVSFGVRDRAYIMVDQVPFGVMERDTVLAINISGSMNQYLDILVENQGRIGFGKQINYNRKGLISNVTLGEDLLEGWSMYSIDIDNLKFADLLNGTRSVARPGHLGFSTPSIYIGQLDIPGPVTDTYLSPSKWAKGQAVINNFNIGRYWPKAGPQIHLFVPKFALKHGTNSVLMLELEKAPCQGTSVCLIEFKDYPLINATVSSEFGESVPKSRTKYGATSPRHHH